MYSKVGGKTNHDHQFRMLFRTILTAASAAFAIASAEPIANVTGFPDIVPRKNGNAIAGGIAALAGYLPSDGKAHVRSHH